MLNIDKGISLIKFSATWCGPCKLAEVTIKKVLPEFLGINFRDIDVDDNPVLAKEYKIRSLPTVIVFKNGEEVTRVGSIKADDLRKILKEVTAEKAA